MRDPELQEAVESLLWSLDERTRCPVCYKIKSHGHTKNCRIGKLHAILNSRVPRSPVEPPVTLCGVTSVLDTKCDLQSGHGGRHRFAQKASARPAPACGNPVMINSEWYRGCVLPSGHEGDCSAQNGEEPQCKR